ncbi:hypothetical protein GGR61_001171 [Xanthomonas arboricola]|nr:hypothetical protein [Xanthomonas sp. 3058]
MSTEPWAMNTASEGRLAMEVLEQVEMLAKVRSVRR